MLIITRHNHFFDVGLLASNHEMIFVTCDQLKLLYTACHRASDENFHLQDRSVRSINNIGALVDHYEMKFKSALKVYIQICLLFCATQAGARVMRIPAITRNSI